MEKTVETDVVYAAIHQVRDFLTPYLGLANTHGAEFLSDDHWGKYVSPAAQSGLLELSCENLVDLSSLTIQDNFKESNLSTAEKNENGVLLCARQTDHGVKVCSILLVSPYFNFFLVFSFFLIQSMIPEI